ncbi:MAG: TolC family protein, partial [Planctomycetota bacterium]
AQRELEVRYQQYELAREQLEQARRKVDAGDTPEIEVVRAESGVAQRLEAIIITRTVVLQRRRDLKRIMNRDDVTIESPTAFILTTEAAPARLDLDPEVLADRAVVNRMEMLELELQLAIDLSSIDFQRNQALPSFVLDYSYNINGVGRTYNDAFDMLPPSNQFADWSVGLRAEIPIGNEAAKARVHQAVLRRLQRLSTKSQRDLAIRQEVFDAVEQLQQNWQRIVAARLSTELARRTYEAEQRQFDVGLRTSTDVLDAAAALADAQSQEIQAVTDYQIAQVDIAFATGTLLGQGRVRWEPIDIDDDDGDAQGPRTARADR